MTAVVGRERELSLAEEFLQAAGERFAVLALEGEAGIGKTTVWREIVRRAEEHGFLVLSCRPAPTETKVALSGLADLLEPLPADASAGLPDPQRRALDVALLRTEAGEAAVDRRTLATAVRSLLRERAAECPILLAVDDIQWLDTASAATLEFVLRRLSGVRIGFLASRRPQSVGMKPDELAEPPALMQATIGPLTLGALHHVLRQRFADPPSRSTLVRIHEATGGNPLFAIEVGRLLAEVGVSPPGEPLPVPSDVSELVQHRAARLPAPTREILLAAAALGHAPADTLTNALGRSIVDDLEAAELEGIASLSHGDVVFEHPLFAAAIYGSSSAAERQRIHGRLAEVSEEPEQRAWHLALAATGRDERAAAAVHAAAKSAVRRGAPTAGAELVELALRLGEPGTATEAERQLDLIEYRFLASEPERARAIVEGIRAWDAWPPALRGRALAHLVELVYWTEIAPRAAAVGEELLDSPLPPEVRAHVHAATAAVCDFDFTRSEGHAETAVALLDELGQDADPAAQALAFTMLLRSRVFLGRGLDGLLVDRVLEAEARLPPDRAHEGTSKNIGQWFKYVDDLDSARAWLERQLRQDTDAGNEIARMTRLMHLAVTECWAGNLARAHRLAIDACELDDQVGARPGGPHATRALVEAHVGNEDEVRSLVDEVEAPMTSEPYAIQVRAAMGTLELSLGAYDAADRYLSAAIELAEEARIREPGVHRVHADAAEAAVARGDLDRAEQIAGFLESHGGRTDHRWSLATGARVRALLAAARGDLDDALVACEEALAHHEALPMPLERARTLLVKGVVERRMRRRAKAKESFEQALGIFKDTGARLWAERAETELRRVPVRRSARSEGLTPTEQRVAELVVGGGTNKEVAQALFLSEKTVEANLTRIYRKVGVRSRSGLAALIAEQASAQSVPKP